MNHSSQNHDKWLPGANTAPHGVPHVLTAGLVTDHARPHRKTLVVAAMMALMLLMGNSVEIISAQGGATGAKNYPFTGDTSTNVNYACEPDMKKFATEELDDFRNFLETNFQNKSSTTSLLPIAIEKYREVRKELMTAYSKYYPNQGAFILTTGLQPGACLKIVNDTLGDARILLEKHTASTAGVKKSTTLLEKYRSINGQLEGLNQQFIQMKALMDGFSQKLPCYIKHGSCTKG